MLAHLAAFRELGVSVGEVDLDGEVHVAEVVVGGDGRVGAEGGMGGGRERGREEGREGGETSPGGEGMALEAGPLAPRTVSHPSPRCPCT